MSRSFREFRVDSICSTSNPDSILNEAGLDDYVSGKATDKVIKPTIAKVSPTKKARAARQDKKDKKVARRENILAVKGRIQKIKAELGDRKNLSFQRRRELKVSLQRARIQLKKAQIGEGIEENDLSELRSTAKVHGEQFGLNEEPIIDAMKKIVRDRQYQKVKLADGKQLSVDMQTANAIVKVYDALSSTNKTKFASTLNKNRAGFMKMSGFAIKNVSF